MNSDAVLLSSRAQAITTYRSRAQLTRYVASLLLPVIACTGELLLKPLTFEAPLLLFYPAVFLAARIGGAGPGLLATLLSAVLANYYVLLPGHSFEVQDSRDAFTLAIFVAMGSAMSLMNAQVQDAEEEARLALVARDRFLAAASHELKTPLTVIKLQVQRLHRIAHHHPNTPVSALSSELGSCLRQSERLSKLAVQLLAVADPASISPVSERETFDLSALVRDAIEPWRGELERSGGALAARAERPIVGDWNRTGMELLLTALLSNATRFAAGRKVTVETSLEDGFAVLTVRDEGVGISPDDLQRIFRMFERASSPLHYSGLGIGLWLAQEIAHAHGGRIEVQSAPGQGTTFRVRLALRPLR
ncbi:MAG: ATP-binding protein [Myxococcales bacterium]